jgi:hypothetical protein
MNYTRDWRRNVPAPLTIDVYTDCGLSARTPIVIAICNKVNELQEFFLGMGAPLVLVPAQGNVDERMPLMYLRGCVTVLQSIIRANELSIVEPPQYGQSMDYHAFVPWARDISRVLNEIIKIVGE